MAARYYRIIFEVDVNRNQDRFRVPLRVLDFLGLLHDGEIDLVIRNKRGRLLFDGRHQMRSKGEVYGIKNIRRGTTILVEASHP